jgi:molecular chaperone GrpE
MSDPEQREPASEAVADEPAPAETGLQPVEPTPEQRLRELQAELDAVKEQLLRKRADFENYRRRVERDRQHAWNEASADVLRSLVPTLDNLERALESGGDMAALREGVALIQRELLALLEARGVTLEDPTGKPFDPERHQALSQEVVAGARPGTVVETLRKGYLFKDRLLRPALVKVAKEETAPQLPDGPEVLH